MFTVYGLSTEGYGIALKALEKGYNVYIVDERLNSPIKVNRRILNYKTVDEFFEEENLAEIAALDEVMSKTRYLMFCPKVRCEVEEIQGYYEKMLKEVCKKIVRNTTVIFWIPLGEGGQRRIATLVYEYSGLKENEAGIIFLPPFFEKDANYAGAAGAVGDGMKFLENILDVKVNPINLEQAERKFSLGIMEKISKYTSHMVTLSEKDVLPGEQHYFNDVFSYYTDLKLIYYSTKRGTPLKSFSGALLRNVESYPKNLVNFVKNVSKEERLKPSRVKVVVLWSKSSYHIRPDFDDAANKLTLMLQDFFADVQLSSEQTVQKKILTTLNRPACVIVACSEKDFRALERQPFLGRGKVIVIKATLPPSRLEGACQT